MLYKKLFAKVYDPFMTRIEKHIGPVRAELLGDLRGRILDVGAGTGANFAYFHPDAEVIAIEPSRPMMEVALKKIHRYPNIQMHHIGVNDPGMDRLIAPASLDYIINTLVLCTIPDPKAALRRYRRWLKPTGRLIVLEHIKSEPKLYGWMQEVFNPVWRVIGDGCHINRHTDEYIREAGFVPVEQKYRGQMLRWVKGTYIIN